MDHLADCPVCGSDCGRGVPRLPKQMAVDQHNPLPDEVMTTPFALGYPRGVYLTWEGVVHEGDRDGYLAHGAHDRIPLSRARELGLLRDTAPTVEQR